MKKKPYRDHVSLQQIVEDGWSRGFQPEQTVDEAKQMGFAITLFEVREQWRICTEHLEAEYRSIYVESN